MKTNKLCFLSFLFLSALTISGYAQSVRYVAYFPVPYVSHMVINANSAFFAGKDAASVAVTGNLSAESLTTEKDLELNSTATAAGAVQALNVNSGADILGGDLVVNNSTKKLTLTNLPTPASTGAVNVNEIRADDSLKVANIKWAGNGSDVYKVFSGDNRSSFSSSTSDGVPASTQRFCWKPLRLKGSYEYQYYLIAVDSNTCN